MANRRAVNANGAVAAAFAAATKAAAHGLNHFHADVVARVAAEANAVGEHFAAAVAAIETALAAHLAITHTLDAARTAIQAAAQLLESRTRSRFAAEAINFASFTTFFHPDLAAINQTLLGGVLRSRLFLEKHRVRHVRSSLLGRTHE